MTNILPFTIIALSLLIWAAIEVKNIISPKPVRRYPSAEPYKK